MYMPAHIKVLLGSYISWQMAGSPAQSSHFDSWPIAVIIKKKYNYEKKVWTRTWQAYLMTNLQL